MSRAMSLERTLWCIVAHSENPHDFEVWGPLTNAETDEMWRRLVNRPQSGRLTLAPMSCDWDAEDEGGPMTPGSPKSGHDRLMENLSDSLGEQDAIVAGLRAVIENCKHTPVEAIRHQLVGLLPEVQPFPPEVAARMRERGMGELVNRQNENVRQVWARYGYGEEGAA